MKSIINTTNKLLSRFGYKLNRVKNDDNYLYRDEFHSKGNIIYKAHYQQTVENVKFLKDKYKEPVFGKIHVFELIKDLAQCIDPTDNSLYCVSQLVHTLQVVEAMEKDGVEDEDIIISALIHDLGKLLLLTDEAPENVVCMNTVVINYEEGVGLDNCIFQWNHDEFVYDRFKEHVNEKIAWIIRYHSIMIKPNLVLMNKQDKIYTEKYLKSFRKYDTKSKSIYNLPMSKLSDYKELIEKYFPEPVMF